MFAASFARRADGDVESVGPSPYGSEVLRMTRLGTVLITSASLDAAFREEDVPVPAFVRIEVIRWLLAGPGTSPGAGTYHSTMSISRFRMRRWALGLTIAALPLIGVTQAPAGLAQDETGPCAWDVASMACMESQTGGGGLPAASETATAP